jgi:hypothetical protein
MVYRVDSYSGLWYAVQVCTLGLQSRRMVYRVNSYSGHWFAVWVCKLGCKVGEWNIALTCTVGFGLQCGFAS